jgi:Holliday junction resolvase RusA-like endonuclease
VNEYNEIILELPKPPSLNQFYSGRHYAVRSKHKTTYWKKIEAVLEGFDKFHMESMSIHVFYNCRYDVDNAICCSKFLADYLRNNGYIDDDSPRFFTSQSTAFDAEVAKDIFVAKIKAYGFKIVE